MRNFSNLAHTDLHCPLEHGFAPRGAVDCKRGNTVSRRDHFRRMFVGNFVLRADEEPIEPCGSGQQVSGAIVEHCPRV